MSSYKVKNLMTEYFNAGSGLSRTIVENVSLPNTRSSTVPGELPVSVKSGYGWKMVDEPVQMLTKQFKFKDRWRLMAFVSDVLEYEDDVEHHGEIIIKYDTVDISVYTHDVDLVTELDLEYAKSVSEIREDVKDYSETGFMEMACEY